MSFNVFFMFSAGLQTPLKVPKGTFDAIMGEVRWIEKELGLETEQYRKNPPRWKHNDFKEVDDETLCAAAERHNAWIIMLHGQFGEWFKNPVRGGERLTPTKAKRFWHALEMITVPPERWTGDYYEERMKALYEALRGRAFGAEGMCFDARALSPRQAASVINLLSSWLDGEERDMDVPKGCDWLGSRYHGDYEYCEKCGPVTNEHVDACRKRGCPAKD